MNHFLLIHDNLSVPSFTRRQLNRLWSCGRASPLYNRPASGSGWWGFLPINRRDDRSWRRERWIVGEAVGDKITTVIRSTTNRTRWALAGQIRNADERLLTRVDRDDPTRLKLGRWMCCVAQGRGLRVSRLKEDEGAEWGGWGAPGIRRLRWRGRCFGRWLRGHLGEDAAKSCSRLSLQSG